MFSSRCFQLAFCFLCTIPVTTYSQPVTMDFNAEIERITMPKGVSLVSDLQAGATAKGLLTISKKKKPGSWGTGGPGNIAWVESIDELALIGPLKASFQGGAIVIADGVLSVNHSSVYCHNATQRGVKDPCRAVGDSISSTASSTVVPKFFVMQQPGHSKDSPPPNFDDLALLINDSVKEGSTKILLVYDDGNAGSGRKSIVLRVTSMTLRGK